MKFFIIFSLAITAVSASELPKDELKSRNIVVPAGRLEGRITKSARAQEGQFPYLVSFLIIKLDWAVLGCGGSLLNNRRVLTAAHCTDRLQYASVFLGTNKRMHSGLKYKVSSGDIITHFGWNNKTLENDLSIVKIPYTPFSELIQHVYLPSDSNYYPSFESSEVVVSGWGKIYDDSDYEDVIDDLGFAYRNIIPNPVCESSYTDVTIRSSHICIDTSDGVSICSGDSGGPLVLANSTTLIGVASFVRAHGCELGTPAVFTRVTSYLDWIKTNAGEIYQKNV